MTPDQTTLREALMQHNDELNRVLNACSPPVARFMRENFELNVYPLAFIEKHVAALEKLLLATRQRAKPRWQRFNEETGSLHGGNLHPDRCVCQEKETGLFAGTPHKHYDYSPHSCARCGHEKCPAYRPAIPNVENQR